MNVKFFNLFLLGTLMNHSLGALEAIHDNLPAFDSSVKEFAMIRPSLFGQSSRKAFVRRDKINIQDPYGRNLDVAVSFISGTGSSIFNDEESNSARALENLNNADFNSVSGKTRDDLSATAFKADPNSSFLNGIDLEGSVSLAQAASNIYLKLPLAAKAFANMGFNEQRYVVGIKSATKGVVLKNDKSIVLAFRGTEPTSVTNWMTNAKFFQVPLLKGTSPKAHLGFYQALTDVWPLVRAEIVSTLENKIRKRIQMLSVDPNAGPVLRSYGISEAVSAPDERPIYFTGHSLGGALAMLLYAELTYNWLDHSRQGYYFVDPTLAKLSDEQVNKIIEDTLNKESFFLSGYSDRIFSINEEDDFKAAGSLAHLAVIQNEARYSLTPLPDIRDVTIDRRLKQINTFGAPRVGDWMFKFYVERYASSVGAQVVRYENFHERASRIGKILQADLIPRIPFVVGLLLSEYAHVGTRASFETDVEDTQGNAEWLRCEYSNRANERSIANFFGGDFANLKFSFEFHKMDLYLKRVRSYLSAQRLDSQHSCNKLIYEMVQ